MAGIFCLLAAASRMGTGRARLHLPNLPFRVLGVTLLAGAALGTLQSGVLSQLSMFLKGVQGYTDIASGVALAPFAIATLIVSLGAGVRLSRHFSGRDVPISVFRRPIVWGLLIAALSSAVLLLLEVDTEYLLIGVGLALLGAGASLANVPRTDLRFRAVARDRVGTSAGLNGSSFLLGEALGNTAVTAMIAATIAAAWQEQMQAIGLTSDEAPSLYATIEPAVFVATANPFAGASYLDVAQQVPGWDTIFTEAFTAALLALCLLGVVAAVVIAMGLRRLPHIRADEGAS